MRKQFEHGYLISDLAKAYGLAESTVSNIVHYHTHKRVRPGPNESREVPRLPTPRSRGNVASRLLEDASALTLPRHTPLSPVRPVAPEAMHEAGKTGLKGL